MFVTMVLAALVVDGLFGGLGLIPHTRPTRADIFGKVKVNYKLFTNILGVAIFAALFALTMRRGATDPVCGMKVDKTKATRRNIDTKPLYFCSEQCAHNFDASRAEHSHRARPASSPFPFEGREP
jgi:YHS domain-containing protein